MENSDNQKDSLALRCRSKLAKYVLCAGPPASPGEYVVSTPGPDLEERGQSGRQIRKQ